MNERLITPKDVRAEMITNGSEFATVMFVKRSDGSTRVMNYRLGVTVFEINKGYRSIPIDGVVSITKAKEKLIVS